MLLGPRFTPGWALGVHRSIRIHAMREAKTAYENLGPDDVLKFRSKVHTRTESIVIAKAYGVWADAHEKASPDRGPLSHIAAGPLRQRRGQPAGRRVRRDLCLTFQGSLKAHGPVRAVCVTDPANDIASALLADGALRENAKILWDKSTDTFHLSVLRIVKQGPFPVTDDGAATGKFVSLDPGARQFQTFYDPRDGAHGELCCGAPGGLSAHRRARLTALLEKDVAGLSGRGRQKHRRRIRKTEFLLQRHTPDTRATESHPALGELVARASQSAYRSASSTAQRLGLRRRLNDARAKLKAWVTNAHYSAVKFLLARYACVLMPVLHVKRLVSNHVLPAHVKRRLYQWSHFTFRQRLRSKAGMYSDRRVLEIEEPGTSKTCGACGYWKADLGGQHVFRCDRCGIQLDRDANGARNNLLAAYGRWTGILPDAEDIRAD